MRFRTYVPLVESSRTEILPSDTRDAHHRCGCGGLTRDPSRPVYGFTFGFVDQLSHHSLFGFDRATPSAQSLLPKAPLVCHTDYIVPGLANLQSVRKYSDIPILPGLALIEILEKGSQAESGWAPSPAHLPGYLSLHSSRS